MKVHFLLDMDLGLGYKGTSSTERPAKKDFKPKRRFHHADPFDRFAAVGHPIENVWDVTVALTALARDNDYQDERVKMERKAGRILAKAA